MRPTTLAAPEENEIWKPIARPELYERYLCSNLGRVKSRAHNIIKPCDSGKGYYHVTLTISGSVQKSYKVHKLIALTFVPNPKRRPEVNHINLIKADNRADNLEWVTHKRNMQHASQHGVLTRLPDSYFNQLYALRNGGLTWQQIADKLNKSVSNVFAAYNRFVARHNLPAVTSPAVNPAKLALVKEIHSARARGIGWPTIGANLGMRPNTLQVMYLRNKSAITSLCA